VAGGGRDGLLLTWLLNVSGVRAYSVYFLVGGLVWLATYNSGVHATIATVALGFLTPARPLDPLTARKGFVASGVGLLERFGDLIEGEGDHDGHVRHRLAREVSRAARSTLSPLDELTNLLHPWVAFFIMPLFALCNAGVLIDASTLAEPTPLRVALGVGLGLVIGKPVGITLFAWLAVKLGLAELPRGSPGPRSSRRASWPESASRWRCSSPRSPSRRRRRTWRGPRWASSRVR
jgi:NhaA family Na+:H+ antiporter